MGAFMAKVFQGERTFLHPLFRPLERLIYRLGGVREEVEQHWTQYAGALHRVQHREIRVHISHPAAAGLAAAQPAGLQHGAGGPGRDDPHAGSGVQHRCQLHDQHELAVVCRRDDGQLLRADGGVHGAELHVGRRGDGDRHRAGARLRAPRDEDARQLLGGRHARDGLHPAAALVHRRAAVRLSGCHSELVPLYAG